MSYQDPLRRRRRRRRNTSVAGLVAALLSAVLYQCTGKTDLGKPASAPPAQTSHRGDSPTARAVPANNNARSGRGESFDFYLLALSLAPAFCEDGHQQKRECQALNPQGFAATPLTLHGLWPENLRPETYPRDCGKGAPTLSAATRQSMERWMPGAADGLARHEWSKHGTCTGLAADDYFNSAMRWTEQINLALAASLRSAVGGSTDAATLRAAANSVRPGLGESIVFVCKNLRSAPSERRRRPYLVEVRACVDNDGPNGAPQTLLQCAAVDRRDQGCGGSFVIDAP